MTLRLASLVARVRDVFGPLCMWWWRELRDMAAAILARMAPRLITRTLIVLEQTGGSVWRLRAPLRECLETFTEAANGGVPALAEATVAALAGTRTEIAMAAELVLTRRLVLPEAVEGDLDRVVGLQLERECPLPVDQVHFDKQVAARMKQDGRIAVDVWIVRRSRIEQLREMTRLWGAHLARIGVSDIDRTIVGNFLRGPTRLVRLKLTSSDRRLIACAATLATVWLGLVGFHWGSERVQLGRELRRLAAASANATTLAGQLKVEAAPAEALVGLMRLPDALDALSTLTEEVPKDSWVYDLDVVAQWPQVPRIKLAGFTPAATMLVGVLGSSHKFDTVRLVSAQSAGLGSAQDRLQVSARLSPPGKGAGSATGPVSQ